VTPTLAVQAQLGELLAADATTLAPAADANEIVLVNAAFVPSTELAIGDLSIADFDGSTPKALGVGTQLCGFDPTTGEQVITMKDPAGGLVWETTGVTNLPQTIFGFAMTNDDGTVLLASELLPEPVTLTAAGQIVSIGQATLRLVAVPMS